MNAKEMMSTPVVVARGTAKLSKTKDLFTRNKISAAPVQNEKGDIEGIITFTDISAVHNDELLVRDIMTKRVHVCPLTARAKDIGAIMTTEKIHHVIAMDDGEICGMISSLDVILALNR